MPVEAYRKRKALRDFEKKYLPFLTTQEDLDLVWEIGFHQASEKRMTPKLLALLQIGAAATVQRRLARLKRLGVVRNRRLPSDRRIVELTLHPEVLRILRQYGQLLGRH
jgi:hypothetical protein